MKGKRLQMDVIIIIGYYEMGFFHFKPLSLTRKCDMEANIQSKQTLGPTSVVVERNV